jgi:hypothetical protein
MPRSFCILLSLIFLGAISMAFTTDDPVWKNLKILPKHITEKQLDSVMHHYSASLNVGCDYCHVENKATGEWDMASDEKKHKLRAREMMKMTDKINDKYFDVTGGKRDLDTRLMVTCYTCHHGSTDPEVKPVINAEHQQADSSQSK